MSYDLMHWNTVQYDSNTCAVLGTTLRQKFNYIWLAVSSTMFIFVIEVIKLHFFVQLTIENTSNSVP